MFKLLKNSMKAHKIIYAVLVLSQIIGMVCLIFLYGVFAEFNGRKQELDIDNKYIDLSFEGVTIGEIKELIRTTCAEVEADLSYKEQKYRYCNAGFCIAGKIYGN